MVHGSSSFYPGSGHVSSLSHCMLGSAVHCLSRASSRHLSRAATFDGRCRRPLTSSALLLCPPTPPPLPSLARTEFRRLLLHSTSRHKQPTHTHRLLSTAQTEATFTIKQAASAPDSPPLPIPALHPPVSPSDASPIHDFPLDAAPPTPPSTGTTAAPSLSGLLSLVPPFLLPYVQLSRFDKPIGTWLLLFPCLWSVALSTLPSHLPSLPLIALFTTGAVLMRGAGCTINDCWDRRFDARVARTRSRPLASGALGLPQALGWLFVQLLGGLAVVLSFNVYTIAWSFASVPIIAVYPLMKRVTHWPQLVLGLCFNWGALVGYTANTALLVPAATVPLYAAGICWSLVYDTIYAHQDTADDKQLGLRSTALYFHQHTAAVLAAISALLVAALLLLGQMSDMGGWYYSAVAGVVVHLAWQLRSLDVMDRASCWRLFISNRWIGWLLLIGIAVDRWMAPRDEVKEREREQLLVEKRQQVWGKTGYEVLDEWWKQRRT